MAHSYWPSDFGPFASLGYEPLDSERPEAQHIVETSIGHVYEICPIYWYWYGHGYQIPVRSGIRNMQELGDTCVDIHPGVVPVWPWYLPGIRLVCVNHKLADIKIMFCTKIPILLGCGLSPIPVQDWLRCQGVSLWATRIQGLITLWRGEANFPTQPPNENTESNERLQTSLTGFKMTTA